METGKLVGFFEVIGKLKGEKRKGWLERGVQNAESVADHSFRLAAMAMVFAKELGLDECKALKLAIVHDLPEAICHDMVVRIDENKQEVSNAEKKEKEEAALLELCEMLDAANAEELRGLWSEFEARESKEARLVYELDRLEALFQAAEYERQGNFKVSLQEFFDYADARIGIPELRQVFGKLLEKRGK